MDKRKTLHLELKSEDFIDDFRELCLMKIGVLAALIDKFEKNGLIKFDDIDSFSDFTKEHNISDQKNFYSVLTVYNHIMKEALDCGIDQDSLIGELKLYIETNKIETSDSFIDSLGKIFILKPDSFLKHYEAKYKAGGLFSLDSVQLNIDLRSVFDDDENFLSFVPMIIMQMRCTDDLDDSETWSFQLSADKFEKLNEIFDKHKKRLDHICKLLKEGNLNV